MILWGFSNSGHESLINFHFFHFGSKWIDDNERRPAFTLWSNWGWQWRITSVNTLINHSVNTCLPPLWTNPVAWILHKNIDLSWNLWTSWNSFYVFFCFFFTSNYERLNISNIIKFRCKWICFYNISLQYVVGTIQENSIEKTPHLSKNINIILRIYPLFLLLRKIYNLPMTICKLS